MWSKCRRHPRCLATLSASSRPVPQHRVCQRHKTPTQSDRSDKVVNVNLRHAGMWMETLFLQRKNIVTTIESQNWKAHACLVKNTNHLKHVVSEYHTKSGLRASCGTFKMEPQIFDSDRCMRVNVSTRLHALQQKESASSHSPNLFNKSVSLEVDGSLVVLSLLVTIDDVLHEGFIRGDP